MTALAITGMGLTGVLRLTWVQDNLARQTTRPWPARRQIPLLPLAKGPYPSCIALLDQLHGAAGHVCQYVNLVVAATAPLGYVFTFAA